MDGEDDVPLAVALEPPGAATPATGSAETVPVPVTIVTGFLGAGKTTLVRNILTADHGYRIAVILNEFGEDVGIESSFVQSSEGLKRQDGEWVELTNGCMCCAVKSDFLQALESLLERPGGRRFDYILIETTGLANPGPIATALWTDAELESRVSLDGVVTVVDAVNISRQLGEPRSRGAVNEAQLQIAYADIVVLNKLDLAGEEAVVRSEADIRAINSGVNIVRTQRSVVDLGLILNRNGYSHKGDLILPPIAEAEEEEDEPPRGGRAGASTPETTPSAPGEAAHGARRRSISCCSSRAHSFHAKHGSGGAIAAAAAAAVAACGGGGGGSSAGGSGEASPAGSLSLQSPLQAALSGGSPHPHQQQGHHAGPHAGGGLSPSASGLLRRSLGGGAAGADEEAGHTHDSSVSTISLRCLHPVDLDRFKSWVDHLLWDRENRPEEVYRMKGLLAVSGSDSAKKHSLQAVYELYEIVSGPEWAAGEARTTRVVIIGRNLRTAAVRASWAAFVDQPAQ